MKLFRRDLLRYLPMGVGTLVAGGMATASRAQGMGPRFDHYTTSRGAEALGAISVVRGQPFRFSTLYSVKVPALRAGDVVQAHAQFELTNDCGINVMLGHAMVVHHEETVIDHSDTRPGGDVICEYAVENITPGMHHGFRTLVGSFSAERDGDHWLSVVIYAAASSAKDGDTLAVEKGYGGLRAIAYRQAGHN